MGKKIFSIWVENQAGVLSEISAIFGDMGLNIDSLAVGVTENDAVSRITLVTEGSDAAMGAIISKVNQLTNLIKIRKISEDEAVLRELALIMVETGESSRGEILSLVDVFRAQVVDVACATMTIAINSRQEKIAALIDLLQPFGVREIVRTGLIAIDRGSRVP